MNQATKEFWDMLFILYLTQQKSNKVQFDVLIGAAQVIDGELFNAADVFVPDYYSYEKGAFSHFFLNAQVEVRI